MDSSKCFLCLCAIFVLSTPSFVVLGCGDKTLCQQGFLCSPDKKCIPAVDRVTLFPNQLKDSHTNSGTASLRILRETKPLDEDGAASIFLGNEGNEDQEDGSLAIRGERKRHRHHSKSHKHGKNKAHHASGGTSGLKNQQNKEKITGLSDIEHQKPLVSDNSKEYRELPKARSNRSTPDVSQWQKILNTLKQGATGTTTQSSAEESKTESNAESDTGRQLEILEAVEHQLEEEIAKSVSTRHGHHRQHPSMDIEAKKEEIQVLKEIEDSLQQTPPTEDNQAMMTGAHTHSNSHHPKHGQLQESESKPLNDASNQAHNNHGQSKPSTHTEAKPNLDKLEKQVFKDILKAESDGLTRKQGIQLEREIESLEEIEKQTTEDLIENSNSQTNLDEAENRLQLWGVLQQLDQKLKTQFPNTKLSREGRSASANAHTETKRERRGSLLDLLLKTKANIEAYRRHKQAQSSVAQQAPNSAAAPSNQQAKASATAKDIGDDIGLVNLDRCNRCEPLIGEEVCGANGKTYASLCHAVNCAGLRESDITAGRCVEEDECVSNKCSERDQCVPMTHGTCLILYSKDGYSGLPCRRYICVSKEECVNNGDHAEVCGENGKTYPSLCYLHKAGVQLVYTGLCRPHLCHGQVCGNDGITYESSCHARAHGVRIDYTGECFTEDRNGRFVNCATVREAGRCDKLQCSDPVLPAGACCPLCGGAILVHPDSSALAELVQSWEEINHLYVVENFLRHLLLAEEASKCELTATLTNTGNFSVILSAASATDHTVCLNAGKNLVQAINTKSSTTQDAMLRPVAMTAALVNPFNPKASVKGYLLNTQNRMISKAADLRGQAEKKAKKALIEADRSVKEKQLRKANKALGQSTTLFMHVWIYACAITCAVAMIVA